MPHRARRHVSRSLPQKCHERVCCPPGERVTRWSSPTQRRWTTTTSTPSSTAWSRRCGLRLRTRAPPVALAAVPRVPPRVTRSSARCCRRRRRARRCCGASTRRTRRAARGAFALQRGQWRRQASGATSLVSLTPWPHACARAQVHARAAGARGAQIRADRRRWKGALAGRHAARLARFHVCPHTRIPSAEALAPRAAAAPAARRHTPQKNGEKRLRSLLTRSPEWASSDTRDAAVRPLASLLDNAASLWLSA